MCITDAEAISAYEDVDVDEAGAVWAVSAGATEPMPRANADQKCRPDWEGAAARRSPGIDIGADRHSTAEFPDYFPAKVFSKLESGWIHSVIAKAASSLAETSFRKYVYPK